MIKRFFSLSLMILLALTAWADDAVVSSFQEWKFDDITLFIGRASSTPQQTINNTLYFTGLNSENTGYGVKSDSQSGTLSDGKTWSATCYAKVPAGSDLSTTFSSVRNAGSTTSTTFDRSFGFNNTVPGTCYVIFSATSASDTYKYHIYHQTAKNDYLTEDDAYKTTLSEIKLSSAKAGTYWINGTGGTYYVYYIKFVPEVVSSPSVSYNNGSITIEEGTSNLTGESNVNIKTYYTTDGTEPTTSSDEYNENNKPTVSSSCTIKAISVNTVSGTASSVASISVFSITTATSLTGGSIAADKTIAIEGETVTLIPTPSEGFEFGAWTVTNTNTSAIIEVNGNSFVMPDNNVNITATFSAINYTVQSTTHTNGSVTFCKTEDGTYTETITDAHVGETIYIKATADNGYEFSSLTSSDVENLTSAATTSFTMPAKDVDITATFTETIVETVDAPTFEDSKVAGKTTVTISANQSSLGNNVSIHYTTDGTDPTAESATYSEPLDFTETTTLKAIAVSTTGIISEVASHDVEINPVASEVYISSEKAWTFNTMSLTAWEQSDGLYYRGSSGRKYTVSPIESDTYIFSDGHSEIISKIATGNNPLGNNNFNSTTFTANSNSGATIDVPMFAFNADVAGTIFVLIKAVSEATNYRPRIYFHSKSSESAADIVIAPTNINTTDIKELRYSSNSAGSFFIGSANIASEIYAVRFVPATTIKVPTNLTGGTIAADNENGLVTLTITPAAGYQLKEGTLKAKYINTNGAETEIEITDNKFNKPDYYVYVTAEFELAPAPPTAYDITVTQPESGGTVGVKVGDGEVTTANTTATAGQAITLSNTPAENYTFTSYSVTKKSGGAAVEVTDGSFTMPAEAVTVTAVFNQNTQDATITADATQSTTYNGTAQALSASASAGGVTITYYTNADHSEGETTTAPTNAGTYYAIVSQSDANYISTPVNVTFTIQPKDLTITAKNQTVSIGGSITDGVGLVTTNGLVEGDELTGITLAASSTEAATESGTITPSNAVIKNGASNYNISYVAGILTVVAGTQSYNIVVPSAVNGNSVSANLTSATAGTEITLTITTAENYTLASISADNNVELSGSGETRTFTMPAANVTITATWTINQADTGDSGTSETYTVTETGGIEVSSVTTNTNSSSITIPAKVGSTSVTLISNDAFSSITNKSYIKSVDLSATSITGVEVNRESGVFSGFPEETMIYMPSGNTAASGQKNVVIGGTCSDFVMTDEKSYSIPTSFTATKATLNRTFTSNIYCTLCLPYAIPAANLGGKIYEFTKIEGSTVKMTEDTDGLDANKPYIFVPSAAEEQITTTSVTVNMSTTPNTENTSSNFTFKGIYENKEFTSTDITNGVYGFAAEADYGASIGQFVKAASGASIKGMRAYLAYNGALNGTSTASTRGEGLPEYLNVVLIHANGSTTNIGRLELMTAEDGSPVYNLNGQRVDSSYKGLVIKNGKKVVKK